MARISKKGTVERRIKNRADEWSDVWTVHYNSPSSGMISLTHITTPRNWVGKKVKIKVIT
jgi:hypothetical protein